MTAVNFRKFFRTSNKHPRNHEGNRDGGDEIDEVSRQLVAQVDLQEGRDEILGSSRRLPSGQFRKISMRREPT
jgi:hypothetical protein